MFSANSSQVSDDKLFVEDVFSTYLYTGNSGTQTITNGIDLAGKGGLIWLKSRSSTAGHPIGSHALFDTVRGIGAIDYVLRTNLTDAQNGVATIQSVNSDGFTFGGGNPSSGNFNGENYASWTFREAPKFFDIVTWTGNGVAGDNNWRLINHALAATPGFIVVKRTDTASNWWTYHRGVSGNVNGYLNLTNAFTNEGYVDQAYPFAPWNADTTKQFMVWNLGSGNDLNVNGATYVAYVFAHDPTSDGIIQCGSFTTDGSANATVNLGYEPQWLLLKRVDAGSNWMIMDNMRGLNYSAMVRLFAENASAESNASGDYVHPTATGFELVNSPFAASATYVYIAIRRGPMRTPTLGTSVFAPTLTTTFGTTNLVTTNFPVDLSIGSARASADSRSVFDRLRGTTVNLSRHLFTNSTQAEASFAGNGLGLDSNVGFFNNWWSGSAVEWNFRRAPSFFDEVCYTGNGVNGRTINHNLGVTPELMIMKNRSSAGYNWFTWDKSADLSQANALLALSNAAGRPAFSSGNLNSTVPTSTVFTIGGDSNASGGNYVTYLFASCAGVSKVGSYTGNGSSQTINCGFAAGARFVMIKRTDSAGDWYVWDTARGIVAANDPHLSLNSTAAEVTTDDSVDTDSSGFVVNQVAATNVNVNAATYIYLAIA